ncbi:MAG TPA: membrane protein insertase YidC [Gemmatimonadaceae bacterium]|nr:membrane protein insertase YidC [Gemmatimonadaceae bacterium]
MDKRFFIALLLTAIVIIVPPLFLPNTGARRPRTVAVDSTNRSVARPDTVAATTPSGAVNPTVATPQSTPTVVGAVQPSAAGVETTTVQTRLSRYAFSSRGAAPVSVVLDSYPSRRPTSADPSGVARGRKPPSELLPAQTSLARYRLALGRDTIALDTMPLRAELKQGASGPSIAYSGIIGGRALTLDYAVVPDSFLLHVTARVAGAPAGSALLVGMPRTLRSNEPDTLDDIGHLAVSYRLSSGDIESIGFSKLDSTEVRAETRPTNWVATRNKYFLVAYRVPAKTPFSVVQVQGGRRSDKVANEITAGAALPLSADGRATFDIYAGPQDFERLQKLGSDLDQVNPYGGFMRGLVQPFAVIVMRALLWIKHTTQLNYGWVLVLFGVIIRIALWPLQQGAMRTSLKMQRLQPELQALQKRYSDDPRKQQEAIMKVYKDHGMSPLSPLMGCLPMLLPMPILFALYFVFQNTIEFRGVPFLWLPDISLKDPYYITPILMGLSMFVMSWIGARNMPPNPQAKMMMYMMPVMLTVFFLNLASGLNLYYAVQNIAAIPQQWLLARERAKEPAPAPVVRGMPAPAQKRRS